MIRTNSYSSLNMNIESQTKVSFRQFLDQCSSIVDNPAFFNQAVIEHATPSIEYTWEDSDLNVFRYPNIDCGERIDFHKVFETLHGFIKGDKIDNCNVEGCFLIVLHKVSKLFDNTNDKVFPEYDVDAVTVPITSKYWTHIITTPLQMTNTYKEVDIRGIKKNVIFNDKEFKIWYSSIDNVDDALGYFALFVLSCLRAGGKGEKNILLHIGERLPAQYSQFTERLNPPYFPVLTEQGSLNIREFYRSKMDTMNRILAVMLRRKLKGQDESKFKAFFDWGIQTPLSLTGFHLYKLSLDVVKAGYNIGGILHDLEQTDKFPEIVKQLRNFYKHYLLFQADPKVTSQLANVNRNSMSLFTYSRVFDGRYHSSITIAKNIQLYWTLIKLVKGAEDSYGQVYAAKGKCPEIASAASQYLNKEGNKEEAVPNDVNSVLKEF